MRGSLSMSRTRTRPRRLLYLIVLFLSVAPTVRILVLFFSKFFNTNNENKSSYSSTPSSLPSLMFGLNRNGQEEKEMSNNENINSDNDRQGDSSSTNNIVGQFMENGRHSIALEEILYVFDAETRQRFSQKMIISFLVPTVSFILLGMIPCFIWVYNLINSKIRDFKQPDINNNSKRHHHEKKLHHILQNYMMILQEDDDSIILQTNKNSNSKSTTAKRKWNIPIPGMALNMKQRLLHEQPTLPKNRYDRIVDDDEECPICLNNFRCGDTIVWSSNSMCSHCFHYDCILSWLQQLQQQQQHEGRQYYYRTHPTTTRSQRRRKLKKKATACPCCRQPFIYY